MISELLKAKIDLMTKEEKAELLSYLQQSGTEKQPITLLKALKMFNSAIDAKVQMKHTTGHYRFSIVTNHDHDLNSLLSLLCLTGVPDTDYGEVLSSLGLYNAEHVKDFSRLKGHADLLLEADLPCYSIKNIEEDYSLIRKLGIPVTETLTILFYFGALSITADNKRDMLTLAQKAAKEVLGNTEYAEWCDEISILLYSDAYACPDNKTFIHKK